jgi:hypothetical protein
MPSRLAKANYLVERLLQRMVGLENSFPATSNKKLLRISADYGFDVVSDVDMHDDICFVASTAQQQDRFASLLEKELPLYNKEVIAACGLRRIILCQELTSKDKRLAGLAELGLWELGTLVIDGGILHKMTEWPREVFHHELFHAIDYRDDLSHYIDPTWTKLNGPGFHYNADLAFVDMPPFDHRNVADAEPGFIDTYAMQNPYEDKATVYASLIVRYRETLDQCKSDEILQRKVQYMKDLLLKFHPSFDDGFWQRVADYLP